MEHNFFLGVVNRILPRSRIVTGTEYKGTTVFEEVTPAYLKNVTNSTKNPRKLRGSDRNSLVLESGGGGVL